MRVERLVFTARATCEVETIDLDERLGSQEVLIRNRVGLVSPGTELAIFTGEHRGFERPDHWAKYPWWPGYCSVGEVLAAGRNVTAVAVGDRVVHEGTHATFARQHAATIVKVPDGLADERAVFFKLLGIAAMPQLVSPVAFGERAVVVGLGMVGNLAAQLCREGGARSVHGADRSPGRLTVARACGIDTWDVSSRSLAEHAATEPPEYVIEAVGLGATVRDAIRLAAPRGRVIILSSPREKVEIDPYFDIHHPSKQVIGTHESARSRVERRPYDANLFDLLASERVRVDPFVTHRIPFGASAQQAYVGLRDDPDHWMGVLLTYDSSSSVQ